MANSLSYKRGWEQEGCPLKRAYSEEKENISEGMCKAGLLGQVSIQRDLCRVLKQSYRSCIRGWQVTDEMPSPESSPSAGNAWDSGCHVRAQTEQEIHNENAPSSLGCYQTSLQPPLTWVMLAPEVKLNQPLVKRIHSPCNLNLVVSLDAFTQGCSLQDHLRF